MEKATLSKDEASTKKKGSRPDETVGKGCKAQIYLNKGPKGIDPKVTFERVFKGKDGEFKTVHFYKARDLDKLIACVVEAKNRLIAPKRKAKSKTKSQKPINVEDCRAHLKIYCSRYVCGAIGGSSLPNGYQSYIDGGQGYTGFAGAAIGIAIPMAVWTLGKCAGWAYRSQMLRMAAIIAIVGAGLLITSLWHVSTAIASLTGSGIWLGAAVAVGLDCGLVATETAAIIAEE